jgi:hypothetical protein
MLWRIDLVPKLPLTTYRSRVAGLQQRPAMSLRSSLLYTCDSFENHFQSKGWFG